jgi:hypothetical protein
MINSLLKTLKSGLTTLLSRTLSITVSLFEEDSTKSMDLTVLRTLVAVENQ